MSSFGLRVASAREWTEAGIWLVTTRLLGRDPSWVGDQGRLGGRHFKRLHRHLAAKHNLSTDHYKKQFGLAWTRGLTSATSLAKSGWTDERKAKARELALNRWTTR